MMVTHGETAPYQLMLQPRVEGEIAFVLKKDLEGPGVTPLDVIAATDYLLPALEIIDSRIADWKIKYEDTIADNASSGFFVLGNQPKSIRDVDLDLCGLASTKWSREKYRCWLGLFGIPFTLSFGSRTRWVKWGQALKRAK